MEAHVTSERRPGSAPGVLEANPDAPDAELTVIAFGEDTFIEETLETVDRLDDFRERADHVWLNVDGVGDAETLQAVGNRFSLPPLLLEDIQNVPQRPQATVVEDRLFVVTLMPRPGDEPVTIEQVSLVVDGPVVITFQEYLGGDVLDPVRNRLRRKTGRIRRSGTDYLTYAILDSIVDSYFPLIESFDRRLDEVERSVLGQTARDSIEDIYEIKSTLQRLEHASRPQRAMITGLTRGETSRFFGDDMTPYLQDCTDHAIQVSELADATRQTASSLMDLHLSLASHRMNEVMKVLTIVATIFIPLTFIAGIYGMNFDPDVSAWNMPELKWRFGYPAVMLVMAAIGLVMLALFRRSGWIGGAS